MNNDFAPKALGFALAPVVVYGASGLFAARNAMAYPPGAPDPEEVRLRKQGAYILAAAALGAYALSRSSVGGQTRSVAEGAAMGSAIAAVIAYAYALRTPPVPPRQVQAGDLAEVKASEIRGLANLLPMGPGSSVYLRVTGFNLDEVRGPIERYRDPRVSPPEGNAWPAELGNQEFAAPRNAVTSVQRPLPPTFQPLLSLPSSARG